MPDIHNSVYDSIQCILPLNTSGTMEPNNMNEEQYCIVSSPQKNQPKKRRTMGLRISSDSTMGGRKHQEDRILIAFDRKDDADYACLCVFDGHGGEHASVYARDHLWENIKKQTGFFSRDHEEVMKAIRQGFHFTQAEMWKVRPYWPKTASGYPSTAGTTVSMAIICGNDMYIAHVGDSRIAIGRQTKKGIEADVLTRDHKPSLPREMDRIAKAGGKVQKKSGVDRVVWTRTKNDHKGPLRRSTTKYEIPFLAVSRSLGDLWSYNFDSCEYVVSPDPEIWHHTIDPEKERFLILASDGLWNVASVYDCVSMVEQYNIHRVQHTGLMKETISHKLVKRGMDLWNFRLLRADNITVITCFFESPETLDDEDDQLALDSVKDWAKAGLKLEGPLPEGLSPFKPPLRRRQACPKLSSLENYNTVFCASKEKYRHHHHSMVWDYEQTIWTGLYPRDLPRVKTCSCSRVKKGMKEVKARAKHSGEHQPLNKIMYARPVGSKRPLEGDQKSEKISAVKKMKLDTSVNRRDSVQAVTSPDVSFGEGASQGGTSSPISNLIPTPPITPCAAGADCVNSSEQDGDNHLLNSSSENLQSQSKTNLENIEVLTPSPRRRKTPRRSPRIQAAAFTIPKTRRSCTIR